MRKVVCDSVKAICLPIFNRPETLRRTLDCIPKDKGWTVYMSLEGTSPRVVESIARHFSQKVPSNLWRNGRQLGCSLHVFNVISAAIADGAEAVLHIEDDIELSPDALKLCDWYLSQPNFKDPSCNGGLALCRRENNDSSQASTISVKDTWMGHFGQGYCFSRAQWFDFVLRHFWAFDPTWGHDIWDYTLAMMAQKLGKIIVRPRFARSRHAAEVGCNGPGIGIFPSEISPGTHTDYRVEE